ncbi:TIGR04222 domain-containing membrane protein [Asanoa iriomotensis]|uniref:TIGR04222 domain-containing membrane protein n=1 Tax=Asanoa iriomotensis TaxID=234613 RepID=A0ABQ4BU19_9ACTN|nr:TIGR04222 domain-containing membrane protein [Asanoa iriomotensis]GIF54013.1 hypothetical protein Air01nite_01080 [Asanoa iriomotensis]
MPPFLSLAVTLVVVRLLIRWLAPAPGRRSAAKPDYTLVAHLAGGRGRVALAALTAARVTGAIDMLPHGAVFRFPGGSRLSDVERSVVDAVRRGRDWPRVRDGVDVREATDEVAARAVAQGLSGALRPLPAHTLAFVGAAAAAVPLAALPWWALAALVPIYLVLIRPTRRSLAGERLVRQVRTARPDLHPRPRASWREVTSSDAALAVALFGPTALRAIDPLFARRLLSPPHTLRHTYAGDGGD